MIIGAAVAGITALMLAAGVVAALPDKTVQFGRLSQGSGCLPPGCTKDKSFHALDRMVPGAVSIKAGETVLFDVDGFHQVAIYKPGKTHKDVVVDESAFPFVNDPSDRVALGIPLADFSYKFSEKGKYLVICNVAPHFEEAQMWGWVNVK
jgi:plastocyanin